MKYLPVLLLLLLFPLPACGEDALSLHVDSCVDALPLDGLSLALKEVFSDPDALRLMITKLANGEAVMDAGALWQKAKSMLLSALFDVLETMPSLLLPMAVLSALPLWDRGHPASSFRAAHQGCLVMLCAALSVALRDQAQLCLHAVARMASVIQGLFPLLLTLMSAVGSTASAALYQPVLTAAGGTLITFLHTVILPLAISSGAVTVLDALSGRMDLSPLATLMRKGAVWLMGAAFTLFLSVTALRNVTHALRDGISIRAAKYAADHLVPVVGGMVADTMDALVGAALLVKNALGVTGLCGLALLTLPSLARCLFTALLYKVFAVFAALIAREPLGGLMHRFSQTVTLFFAIQLAVMLLFFLLTAQLLSAGNLIVMLR